MSTISALTAKITNLQDAAGANGSTPVQIQQGRAKAWLNLNGTGTIALRDSFNISSVTDVGTGNYGMTFATAMPGADYAPVFNAASGIAASIYALGAGGADPTVNGCRVIAYLSAAIDTAFFTGTISGD